MRLQFLFDAAGPVCTGREGEFRQNHGEAPVTQFEQVARHGPSGQFVVEADRVKFGQRQSAVHQDRWWQVSFGDAVADALVRTGVDDETIRLTEEQGL